MNEAAIQHRGNADDAYAVGHEQVAIRLRTARGDCHRVTLVTIDKYRYIFDYSDWHHDEFRDVPMRHVASDGVFDYYEATVDHGVLALSYYFRLEGDGETLCYGRGHLFDESAMSMSHLFTMPYPEPEDLFVVPDWTRQAVIYQIFPDSFYRGDGAARESRFGEWTRPTDDGSHLGGTLQGVRDKLPYLEELGVNTLYMTPVFASNSNHRYNTSDYYQVDPILGSKETLVALVEAAHRRGMRVILDAVMHATGTEFFAFQDLIAKGEQSRYKDCHREYSWRWYHVEGYPLRLSNPPNNRAWAYHHRLPKMNLANPEVRAYMLGVLEHWVLEADIDGWRMDTCDEASHDFWRAARKRVKAAKADALLAGEVWYDARPWLAGDQLDTVMNYGFRDAVLGFFARDTLTPVQFSQRLGRLRGRHKRQAWQALWNLLGSHDTVRFLAEAGGDVARPKLAALFRLTYPGVPFLYYGDEVGMGRRSRAYRDGMRWEPERQDGKLLAFYQRLIALRSEHPALVSGTFDEVVVDNGQGMYCFRRSLDGEAIDIYVNNGDDVQVVDVGEPVVDLLGEEATPSPVVRLAPRSGVVVART